jgi:hypothetical protein
LRQFQVYIVGNFGFISIKFNPMKKLLRYLCFAFFLISTVVDGQSMFLNSDRTSYEITPDGIQANKSGASFVNSYGLGFAALRSLTAGSGNVAVGYYSLEAANATLFNVGVGSYALRFNSTGVGNTALGYKTLYSNLSGTANLAVGNYALYNTTTGGGNVVFGHNAMEFNLTGKNNVALGNYALQYNGSISGGSVADSNSLNVAIGHHAMEVSKNTSGVPSNQNVTIGHYANRPGGYRGVTIGYRAAEAAFQMGVVVGNASGKFVSNAVIIGDSVLVVASPNSLRNTVIGHKAMKNAGNNTSDNVAVGQEALRDGVTAVGKNTVVGNTSMKNMDGYATENTVVGANTMLAAKSGSRNTAIGDATLATLTASNDNLAVGYLAGFGLNTDTQITSIGAFSGLLNGNANVQNATLIGYSVATVTSNSIKIGNTSVTSIGGYQNFTTFSDRRLKRNISYRNTPGLDFVLSLQPARYRMADGDSSIRYGLIAQDVHRSVQQLGTEFPGLYLPTSENPYYRISYETLTVPLIKAVQELDAKITPAVELRNAAFTENQALRAELRLLLEREVEE